MVARPTMPRTPHSVGAIWPSRGSPTGVRPSRTTAPEHSMGSTPRPSSSSGRARRRGERLVDEDPARDLDRSRAQIDVPCRLGPVGSAVSAARVGREVAFAAPRHPGHGLLRHPRHRHPLTARPVPARSPLHAVCGSFRRIHPNRILPQTGGVRSMSGSVRDFHRGGHPAGLDDVEFHEREFDHVARAVRHEWRFRRCVARSVLRAGSAALCRIARL